MQYEIQTHVMHLKQWLATIIRTDARGGKMIMGKVNMLISKLNCKQPSSRCVIIKHLLCASKNMSETSKQPRMKPGRGN